MQRCLEMVQHTDYVLNPASGLDIFNLHVYQLETLLCSALAKAPESKAFAIDAPLGI